ncbi:hypothetical protein FAZ69_13640 [Trinickia terrae]|uniref:Uncharacterized protein n=1 Tax=Trinickia terrae TaxID=2571161 RepID=A0A4U1I5Z0_9BURK|nr:hypothetical protein [Trinickia terrae]TKC88783.1 hypothetical protein FAZ69_13640 [Trinickia terrae]
MTRALGRRVAVSVLAIAILFSGFVRSVFASSAVLTSGPFAVCTTSPIVYYVNGVGAPNEFEEQAEATKLGARMDQYGQPHYGPVHSLYNPSEGLVLDIFRKLIAQKFGEYLDSAPAWEFIEQGLRLIGAVPNTLAGADLDAVAQVERDAVATTVLNGLDPAAAATLERITARLTVDASFGEKVVIVAHSEGNMFAQALYKRTQLAIPNSYNPGAYEIAPQIQVVNVATPANAPDTGLYVTSMEDRVIAKAAVLLASTYGLLAPAPANFDSGAATYSYDKLGHAFVGVYLNQQLGLEAQTLGLMKSAAANASSFGYYNPEGPMEIAASVDDGSTTYTVTAPDGSNTTSVVSGGSTQVIFQPTCDQLKEGTYRIQAVITPSYLRGFTSPYLASTSVTAVRPLTQIPPRGSTPLFWYMNFGQDPSPVTMESADIVVAKDSVRGGFDETYYRYHP